MLRAGVSPGTLLPPEVPTKSFRQMRKNVTENVQKAQISQRCSPLRQASNPLASYLLPGPDPLQAAETRNPLSH